MHYVIMFGGFSDPPPLPFVIITIYTGLEIKKKLNDQEEIGSDFNKYDMKFTTRYFNYLRFNPNFINSHSNFT